MSTVTDNADRRERRERRRERLEQDPRNEWRWRVGTVRDRAATLIDIGVARGTPRFYRLNPTAHLFLIDPIEEFRPVFERILSRRPGGFEVCAVGSAAGELEILHYPDRPVLTSAMARKNPVDGNVERRTVPVRTLDQIVEAHDLKPPFGIKIDTEGYELEVIKGAAQTLARTAFVIAETSVARRFENGYSFQEFLAAMGQHGFVVDNILSAEPDPNGRVRYMDILYVPERQPGAAGAAPDPTSSEP